MRAPSARCNRPRGRRGFTLLEVLLALLLAGLAVAIAQRVFGSMAEATRSAARAARSTDQRRNAERWLAEALGSIEVGLADDVPFTGSATRLHCTTRLRVARGWRERSVIELTQAGDRFVARTDQGSLTLADSVDRVAFDYLLEPGLDAPWMRGWQSPVSAPLAIRIRVSRQRDSTRFSDTLVIVLGPRG